MSLRSFALFSALAASPVRQDGPPPAPTSTWRFEHASEAEAFGDDLAPLEEAFTAVAADFDCDGDLDLLINRHVEGFELFANQGDGTFLKLDEQALGLHENPGIPDLVAPKELTDALLADEGADGVYLWRGARRGPWLCVVASEHDVRLEFDTSARITSVGGLAPTEYENPTPSRLVVTLEGPCRRKFRFLQVGIGMRARLVHDTGVPAEARARLLLGARHVPAPEDQVELFLPDPHGVLWLDLAGSPHPDLFATRGAQQGTLTSDVFSPKQDKLYEWKPANGGAYEQLSAQLLAPSYARGRAVEAVDVAGDGRVEIWVANRGSPNALLNWNAAKGSWIDRAGPLGLASIDAETAIWFDVDGDRREDLLTFEGGELALRRWNGEHFVRSNAAELGLELPPLAPSSRLGGLFERLRLLLIDFDLDGDLDLLVTGHGPGGELHLFENRGPTATPRFARRADRLPPRTTWPGHSITAEPIDETALLIDAEGDGRDDVLLLGARSWWLRNTPAGFVPERLGGLPRSFTGVVADFDGDAREDIGLIGEARSILWNRNANQSALVVEVPHEPQRCGIGTLVTAVYASGRAKVQRFGSARNPMFSQTANPLLFGCPPDDELTQIEVRWPGEPESVRVSPHDALGDADGSARRLRLIRN